MDRVALLLLLSPLLLLLSPARAAADDADAVADGTIASPLSVALSNLTFDEFVASTDIALVKFYAPWCGHCKRLAPEWVKAAETLKEVARFGEVDCTVQEELCGRYGVHGYPAVKLFRKDKTKFIDYDKARESEAIVKFVRRQMEPAHTRINSRAEATAKLDSSTFVSVLLASDDDQAATDAFFAVAQELFNDFDFVWSNDPKVAKEFGVHRLPAVLALRTFDEKKVVFKGEYTVPELQQFIRSYSFPLLGVMGPEVYQKYEARGLPIVWAFVDAPRNQSVLDVSKLTAKSFLGKLSFVQLDGIQYASHGKSMGLASTTPGFAITFQKMNFAYQMETNKKLTAPKLRKWCESFLAGKLEPSPSAEQLQSKAAGHRKA